jgi:aspartate kinase
MKVLKFGGSSVADPARISQVCSIISRARQEGPVAVVVSALGGTTDVLVELADGTGTDDSPSGPKIEALRSRHSEALAKLNPDCRRTEAAINAVVDELHRLVTGIEYISDCPPAVRDRILACGERLSAPLVAAALRAQGATADAVDGAEVIVTDGAHGAAAVDLAATAARSRDRLIAASGSSIPIVTGFIGATSQGRTTTLGRGGSDLTATVLGAVLDAELVEIWTDVNGIFTAPPRVVAGARPQPCVSYDEAAEMARFGAAVLFSKTVAPIRERSIPVVVRNTFDPDGPSTWVDEGPEVPVGARSVASVERAVMFKVRGTGSNTVVTTGFADVVPRCLIAALAAASGEWTLVTDEADADAVDRSLRGAGMIVHRTDDASVVSVIGSRLLQQPWVAGRALEALGRRDIALKGYVSPSEHSVCVVVDRADHHRTLAILHDALMLSHLAAQAANAARKAMFLKGPNSDSPTIHSGDPRRDRDRRPAARPPAA